MTKQKVDYKILVYIFVILYVVLFSALSILKHQSFNSTALDLGTFDQVVWGFSKGKMAYGVIPSPLFAYHVQPILFLIVPLYWIYSSPIVLLLLQTIILGIGAIPIYLLSKKVLKKDFTAFAISVAYLLHPSIQYMNLFDFHPVALAVTFILFSLYFLEIKNYPLSFIFLVLAGLCKEYMPLLFVTFGVYIFFKHKQRALSIINILIGIVWTYINFGVIIPHFSNVGYIYLKTGIIETIVQGLSNPMFILTQKIPFFILLLIPIGLGLFVFFSPIILLSVFHIGMITFFSPIGFTEIIYHHQSTIIPFVIVSSIYGIRKVNSLIHKKKIRERFIWATGVFILTTSLLSFIVYSPFTILYDSSSFNPTSEYVHNGHDILLEIEPNESIVSTNWIVPHLSQRDNVFMVIYFTRNESFHQNLQGKITNTTYILLDLSEAIADPKRSGRRIKTDDLNKIFNNQNYGISEVRGTWVLLKYKLDYDENIFKIEPFLDNEKYPYLNITLDNTYIKN